MTRWLHLAVLLVAPLTLAGQDASTLATAIASQPDFSLDSDVALYEGEDLASVMGEDFDAAVDYGISRVSVFQIRTSAGTVSVTLSEMIDSAAAFGLFSERREWRERGYAPVALGAEGYADTERIVFWQSRFVVELAGPRDASQAVGRLINSEITGQSRKPTVVTLLPPMGLVPDSERYVVRPSGLGDLLGPTTETLFRNDAEAAVADYRDGEDEASLVLLSYPTPQLARLQSEAWLEDRPDAFPTRRSGLLFGIVVSSNSTEFSESILSDVRSQFDFTLVPPPPDPLTIQKIILTAFAWIGIAILFTLAAGLGFGALRIYMKTRYTGGIFAGDEETGFVQLNIGQPVRRNKLSP